MKTPAEILMMANTEDEGVQLAFRILNNTYTEQRILEWTKKEAKQFSFTKENVFAGPAFIYYVRDGKPGAGYIYAAEWENFWIILTCEYCCLKMKTSFRNKEWPSWCISPVVKVVKYKEEDL